MPARGAWSVGCLAAAGIVVLDETVLWAGQPAGDPSSDEVTAWYAAHQWQVVLGDALWVAAVLTMVGALWVAATAATPLGARAVRILGVLGGTLLTASATVAAWLAGGGPGGASAWHLESGAYHAGVLLVAAATAGLAIAWARSGRAVLAVGAAVAAALLVPPATAIWGLAGAAGVLALGSMARSHVAHVAADTG